MLLSPESLVTLYSEAKLAKSRPKIGAKKTGSGNNLWGFFRKVEQDEEEAAKQIVAVERRKTMFYYVPAVAKVLFVHNVLKYQCTTLVFFSMPKYGHYHLSENRLSIACGRLSYSRRKMVTK